MADVQFGAYVAARAAKTALVAADLLVVSDSAAAGVGKKVTWANAGLSFGDGAAATPSFAFASDPNTGSYWLSTGLQGVACDGVQVAQFSAPAGLTPQVLVVDGTAAKPAVAWITDGGMGLWRSSANVMTFSTGGATRMSFATAGITFASGSTTLATASGATLTLSGSTSTAAGPAVRASNSVSFTGASAIQQIGVELAPTVNQTSTTGFTALAIAVTETALGSGAQYLIDAKSGAAGTTRAFSVTNRGGIGVQHVSTTLASGNTDDYAGIGGYGVWRATSDGAGSVLRGILAPADARMLTIVHIAGLTLTINNNDGGSAAANRILTSTGAAVVLAVGDTATFWYDLTTASWRQITAAA